MDNFKKLVLLYFLVILFANTSFSQSKSDSINLYYHPALQKGNFAMSFQLGSLLFATNSNDNNYISYNMILTMKYHFSDNNAIRLSWGTYLNTEKGVSKEIGSYYYYDGDIEDHRYSLLVSLNSQHYFKTKYNIKPFFSYGLISNYYYRNDFNTYDQSNIKVEYWKLGPVLSFGVEYFFTDFISLNGEYLISATYGKYLYDNRDNHKYSTTYEINFNNYRIGASVYF